MNRSIDIRVEVIRTYMIKYRILAAGDNIDSIVIQPRWPIEEYARRGRSCVWFIPINPPISAAALATGNRSGDVLVESR